MQIHRVEVRNFRRHEHFELDLRDASGQPRPCTILVGPNMSGKTTALDAIHLAYEAVRNWRNPAWRPGFNPSDPTLRPDPNAPIEVTIEWSLHPGEWAAMQHLESALHGALQVADAPLYRFRLSWPPSDPAKISVSDASPAGAQLALRGRALASLALHRRVVSESVLDDVGGLLYLDQNRRSRLANADERHDFRRDAARGSPIPEVVGWLARASVQSLKWDESTRGESQWNRVKRIFADLAAPAKLEDVEPYDEGWDLRLRRGDRAYSAAGTSSGERQILRLAANFAHYRTRRSVVMIDELELNLHPKWQRSVLRFCLSGGDDENQFLVTTHSDEILRYAPPESVVTLGVPSGGWS